MSAASTLTPAARACAWMPAAGALPDGIGGPRGASQSLGQTPKPSHLPQPLSLDMCQNLGHARSLAPPGSPFQPLGPARLHCRIYSNAPSAGSAQ
eukprot:scaffold7381_cov132-Isochrysis_galbana.AAC.1